MGRWPRVIGAVVALVVIGAAAWRIAADWRQLPLDAFHLQPGFLVLSWGVQSAGWLLSVLTWRRILASVGAAPGQVSFRRHVRSHTVSALGNVVPGSVWLPASRLALYRRDGFSGLTVAAAVGVEWLVVGLAGSLLYAVTVPFSVALPAAGAWVLALAAAAALVSLHPSVLPRVIEAVSRKFDPEAPVPQLPGRVLVGLIGRELGVLVASGIGFYFLMRAVAPTASLADALSAWALSVAVANLLAWVPATLVLKDGAMVLALAPLFESGAIALGVVLVWRIWMTVVLLSWAGIALVADRGAAEASSPDAKRNDLTEQADQAGQTEGAEATSTFE